MEIAKLRSGLDELFLSGKLLVEDYGNLIKKLYAGSKDDLMDIQT